jgi:histidinol-phosphate aminotransferase
MLKLAESHILSISPYVPGYVGGEGDDLPVAELASNENCLGPSPAAIEAARKSLHLAHLYPNNKRSEVIQKICLHLADFDIRPAQVALGNGSSELIVNLVRGLLAPHEAMLTGWPTFIMYRQAALSHARHEINIAVKSDFSFDLAGMLAAVRQKSERPVKLIFLANPNNPTGNYIKKSELDDFVAQLPKDIVLVIDEAYFEYVLADDYPNGLDYVQTRPRTIVLRTFSKIYGMAGLRLGYGVGDEKIIDILCRINDPFNVNVTAQHAAIAALDDSEHVQKTIEHISEFKPELIHGLTEMGFLVHHGVGNFVIAKRAPGMPTVSQLWERLLKKSIVVRPMTNFGLAEHIRVSVGTKSELGQLFRGLRELI